MAEHYKIVYILVSSAEDLYFEQTYISITSLRIVMPDAYVVLLTDETTDLSLTGFRSEIRTIVNEYKVVKIDGDFDNLKKSRYFKTTMRRYVTGDFLYIDGDTVICESLNSISEKLNDLYAVLDVHQPFSQNINKKYIEYKVKKLGWHAAINDYHYNGGVIFSKETEVSHSFFNLWNKLWLESIHKSVSIDQTSFNETNYRMNGVIGELNGVWNCQVAYGVEYLSNAKIIHYFGSNIGRKLPYLLTNTETLMDLRKSGRLTPKVVSVLKSPRTSFNKTLMVSDESIMEILSSNFFKYMSDSYMKKSLLYKTIMLKISLSEKIKIAKKKLFK